MRTLLPFLCLLLGALHLTSSKTFKPNKGLRRTNPRPCTPKRTINYVSTRWSPWGGQRTPKWTNIFRTPAYVKAYMPEAMQRRRMAFLLARGVITTLGKGEIATETSTHGPLNFPETTIHPALFVFYNMLRYDSKGEIATETSTHGPLNFPETTIHPALFVFYNMLRYDNVKRSYVTPYGELVLDLMGKRHKLDKIIRNGQNTRWLVERGWTSTVRVNRTYESTRMPSEKKKIREMMEALRLKYEKESKAKRGHRIFTGHWAQG